MGSPKARRLGISRLDEAKELLRRIDENVRVELIRRMDPAPGHSDGADTRGAGGGHVEGGVADIRAVCRYRSEPLEREQNWRRIRLVALGLLGGDDDVEVGRERHAREREVDGDAPLRRHDPEPPTLVPKRVE